MTFGDFLYFVGFQVEYTAVRLARRVWAAAQWAAWAALTLLAMLLRPVVRAAANFKAARCAPRQLADYLLPVLACAALAVYLHTALSQPFVLRVEVNGQSVGYVAGEAAFEAARADVQARINGVADWQIQPEYTLVRGGADTPTLTEREIADAILRASGGEITEGTAVYIDGALQFITTEGDHLRQFLYALRRPWQREGVQTAFVHGLRMVDGIYPAAAVTPYPDLIEALQHGDGLLQVKVVRYETVTKALPFETQTVEDPALDFGKTETVQDGQDGAEQVTSEITEIDGTVAAMQAVDVQLLQPAVPEIIHRGTRLKSGMIGKLGTGSFLWPVPGYSGISRWANLPYGHRGVDITAAYGTPIYAADAGTVIAAKWHNHPTMSWGYYVELDHGNGYKTLYAHMCRYVVQAGQTVEKGQLIGYVGATGAATGNHCHFEMYYNNALISARNVFPFPAQGDRRPCVFVQPCCVSPYRPARKLGDYIRLSGAGRCPQAGVHGQGLHQSGYGPPAQTGVLPLYPKLPPCGGVQLRHRRLQYADRGAVRHNTGAGPVHQPSAAVRPHPHPDRLFYPGRAPRCAGGSAGGMITGIPRSAAGRSSPSASGRKAALSGRCSSMSARPRGPYSCS